MLDIRGLDDMTASKRHSGFFKVVNLSEMVGCLEDLITYFAQPEEELSKLDHLYNRKSGPYSFVIISSASIQKWGCK